MLNKRIMLIGMGLILSNGASAGWYAGLGVGPEFAKLQDNARIRQTSDGILNFNVKNKVQLSGNGAFGTFFAGYGKTFSDLHMNNFYMAAEINANPGSLESLTSNNEYVHLSFSKTKFIMQSSYGISALPGYQYSETCLFYLRFGYSSSNLKINTSDISLKNINHGLNGFRWGIGIKEKLYQHISARMEYSQAYYNHVKFSTLDTSSNTSKFTSIYPMTNTVEFSFIYDF